MSSHRQTISFLTRRFEEAGIRPATRHGQNFLIDLNLVQLLADTANVGPQDVVLEVGTGTGSLTALVAAKAAAVVTVEIDAQLHQLASEELSDFDNVIMLRQDVLKNKNRFDSRVLDVLQQQLNAAPGRRLKLVANLPYNIATPVISNLLSTQLNPVSMTATIQKELAERITASPGTKDFSALSVWIQSQCDTQIVRVMPPSVFWPKPKVSSAIVHIVPRNEKRARIPDLDFFHAFVRAIFFHRRKLLRSVLASAFKKQLDKQAIDEILDRTGIAGDCRAEQLSVNTILVLCEAIRNRLQE